jgi:hypothetical protein
MSSTAGTPLLGPSHLSRAQLAAIAGIRPSRLGRLVREGLVEPEPGSSRFTWTAAARLRRMLRLHAELGVNLAGAMIIVNLLERLARVESELGRFRDGN